MEHSTEYLDFCRLTGLCCARLVQRPWSELDDGMLIAAYRKHAAEAAFSELVHRYEGRLFRVLMGMVGDIDLAEELCQRALVKAALNLDQLSNGHAFYAWLLRVARYAALDEMKKRAHAAARSIFPIARYRCFPAPWQATCARCCPNKIAFACASSPSSTSVDR